MAYEFGDPFDGASPRASPRPEAETGGDMLGVEIPIGDFDFSMPDFEGQYPSLSHTAPTANMVASHGADLAEGSYPNQQAIMIKEEPLDEPFILGGSINTTDDPIEISDSEDDDVLILQPDGTSVSIKKEDDEVEFLWEKMDDYIIDLDSEEGSNATSTLNPGKSFMKGLDPRARRSHIDRAKALQAQEAYRRASLRNKGISESLGPKRSEPSIDDDSAWMQASFTLEDDGSTFRALKKDYNAKVKTNSNTMEDDIEFKRAEKAEKQRVARLDAAYKDARGYSDSDDGLFVTSGTKRHANDESDAGDENRGPKQRKARGNGATQRRVDQELETNLRAGIEEFLSKGKRGKGKSAKVDGPKRTKRRGNKYLSNSNSLLTSNVYEDADANFNREALQASGYTDKRKALAALVASVPLGITEKDAIAEKNRIKKATETLGRGIRGYCKADGENAWKFPGLKSSLHHHQVQGAAFMKERETGGEEPLGGILADMMGLGKTIMTIALLLANPPPRDEKHRATLIVCTPGLLLQWERELEKHTEPGYLDDVLRHHSVHRFAGKGAANMMQSREIILTTYQEVVKSYPKVGVPEQLGGEDELKAWWEKRWNQERDILHRVQFYRVVLDEAQVIKNHESQTSIACRALMAKYRWVCSATPIMNHTSELFPYFKFLRVPYTGTFGDFYDNYCREGNDDCNSRLHCLLDQIMCRRTLKDSILGRKIVDLPKHNQQTINVTFSPVESAIYYLLFKKFVGILNKASADGTLEKHPGVGLVAFLRLRQMCAHTFLAQDVLEELLDPDTINSMERELICRETAEEKNDRMLLAACRRMIAAKREGIEVPEEPEQVEPGELAAKFGSFLKNLRSKSRWIELRARTQCYSCGGSPESAMVTTCLHVYCKECLVNLAFKAAENGQDRAACRACGVVFAGAEPCDGLKELTWDDRWLLNALGGRKKKSTKVNMEWVFHENELAMSAKITAASTQVEKWLEEEPGKKIIIFSQFHMIMQILEKLCQKKEWKYCTYHGKMSHQTRDQVINDFTEDAEMKIMIASLKCGGVGLNLTMASKVICIDLWYNNCVEQQAFCRVFRIGQGSETFITRFVVNKSADEKLIEMQLKKNALIAQAMDDRTVLSKLTTTDILRLFGEVKLDKDKRPFIYLDEDEKLDRIFNKNNQNGGEQRP